MGWFGPTEMGERLMPALTFLGPYHEQVSRVAGDGALERGVTPGELRALAREALTYKLSDEAGAALDALRLELRDADGRVVPTDHISVQDTEYLLALDADEEADVDFGDVSDLDDVDDTTDEFDAGFLELGIEDATAVEEAFPVPQAWMPDRDESWGSSTLPRYQIFVELVDGRSIPVADRWNDDPYVQSLVSGGDVLAGNEESDVDRD